MRETLRHKRAWNYYYAQGGKRSFRDTAQEFGVSVKSIQKWSDRFNWQQRIIVRDKEIGERLEANVNTEIADIRGDILRDAQVGMQIVKTSLDSLWSRIQDGSGEISVGNTREFRDLIATMKDLTLVTESVIGNRSGLEELAYIVNEFMGLPQAERINILRGQHEG